MYCTVALSEFYLRSCVQGDGSFHVHAKCSLPRWAVQEAGAPEEVWLDIHSEADSDVLKYNVIWVNKTATRLPEVALPSFTRIMASASLLDRTALYN